MILTCKCLNITIETKESGVVFVKSTCPSFTPEENREIFKEGANQIEIKRVIKQVDSLVKGRTVKNQIVERCLNCSLDCYSLSDDRTTAFANLALISDLETIKKLKNDKNFSPAFRIVIQPSLEKSIIETAEKNAKTERLESAVVSLQKQLSNIVQEQITKTEERIRTFSEQEYAHLKDFRERAHRDHRHLLEAIYAAQRFLQSETSSTVSNDFSNIRTQAVEIPISKTKTEARTTALNSASKARRMMQQHERYLGVEEKNGSFDCEGLFTIEGMEDWTSDDPGRSEGDSDTDHDDSGSHDEGIDIHRKKESVSQLAKSLPVNVPVCTNVNQDFEQEEEPQAAVDIAASIKALARSLHGDAVFGDLPRPRFSTQI